LRQWIFVVGVNAHEFDAVGAADFEARFVARRFISATTEA
jgi:hypothetical protein